MAAERQALQLLISNTLNELDVFRKVQPLVESVMAQEAAEVQMKETIEHERTTTATVRQLRNDLKDEKIDHEEKVRRSWGEGGQGTADGKNGTWDRGLARRPACNAGGQPLRCLLVAADA